MSYQASKWATRQTAGSATAKLVLLVLAEAADEDGFTFLGQEEIANRAELTRRAVIDQMGRLQEGGLIHRTRRVNAQGHRTSDAIYLQMAGAIQGEPDAPRPSANVNMVHLGLSEPDARLSEPDDVPTCTTFTGIGQITVSEPSVPAKPSAEPKLDLFAEAWDAFPETGRTRSSTALARKSWAPAVKRAGSAERLVSAVRRYAASQGARKDGGQYVEGFHRWLKNERFEHWLDGPETKAQAAAQIDPNESWRIKMRQLVNDRIWRELDWGPKPSRTAPQPADVQVPDAVLAEFGFPVRGDQQARTLEPRAAA